jgi:hypothetical protein
LWNYYETNSNNVIKQCLGLARNSIVDMTKLTIYLFGQAMSQSLTMNISYTTNN